MNESNSPLDQIQITSPCPASWDSMKGDERVRYCDLCKLNVFDVSKMSKDEALRLIRSSEGRLCVRLWRRPDGRILTSDCGITTRHLMTRRKLNLSLAAASLLSMGLAGLGCTPPKIETHQHTQACDPKNAKPPKPHQGDPKTQITVEVGNIATTRSIESGTYVYPSEFIEKLPL